MENISLNNGQTVIIGSNRDIVEVVGEHCSYELASLISAKMVDIDAEKLYAEKRACTDADSYLASLESAESCLRDALEELEDLQEYIENAKRIDKDVIYQKITRLAETIGNEL